MNWTGAAIPAPFGMLLAAGASGERLIRLSPVDIVIIALYFVMVLGIGFYLKRFTKSGEDFFLAGREMTAWVAGLAFLSANLGSLELMGWAAAAYQYGILSVHWYWIGAIPAMVFLGVFMMPFYYISKTHSVPGYLQLRYSESTRALAGVSFALMTVLMSGINMYAMALVMKVVLGWDINFSIWVASITVAVYVAMGGLFSAIFNEVLQFFLIWLGALLIPIFGMIEAGGWSAMVARIHANMPGQDYTSLWSTTGSFADNPMGIHWTGLVFGLCFVISFGYWTTDFLVVQRVIAAKDLRSAKLAPIIASYFKMAVPFIVILFIFGLALGVFTAAFVLYLGPAAEWIAWPLPFFLQPFAGVFYPIAVLPGALQIISKFVPPSYVFEGMRSFLFSGTVSVFSLWVGIGLSVLYLFLAYMFFISIYRSAVRKGRIIRFSAEE